MEVQMNAKRISIQKYVAFSIALMMALIVALVGWRILDVWAAAATPEYPIPTQTEIVPTSLPTIMPTAVVDDPVDDEPQPTQPEPTPVLSDRDAIKAVVAAHFGLIDSDISQFWVEENTGTQARGQFDLGYFLAAKVDGYWVFVAGGDDGPNCDEIAKYDFPARLVPECPVPWNNMPDCPGVGTTIATFIKDVTITDGSKLEPGEYFTKTWRIKNVGTCTWNADYDFIFDSGDRMGGVIAQPLTVEHVPPGATIDISVQLRAPEESGSYRGYWRFQDSRGEDFGLTSGGSVWVDIKVKESSSDDDSSSEGYTGYPFIEILEVTQNQTVKIRGKNLPAQDKFNVVMNYYGTYGENGAIVESILTGDGGEFTDTFQIPAFLQGQSTIAIRLESPYSGYYAYNWFLNN